MQISSCNILSCASCNCWRNTSAVGGLSERVRQHPIILRWYRKLSNILQTEHVEHHKHHVAEHYSRAAHLLQEWQHELSNVHLVHEAFHPSLHIHQKRSKVENCGTLLYDAKDQAFVSEKCHFSRICRPRKRRCNEKLFITKNKLHLIPQVTPS